MYVSYTSNNIMASIFSKVINQANEEFKSSKLPTTFGKYYVLEFSSCKTKPLTPAKIPCIFSFEPI